MTFQEANNYLTVILDFLRGGENFSGETHSMTSKRVRANSSDVYCTRCYQRSYVSEEEKDFLVNDDHVVNDRIVEHVVTQTHIGEKIEYIDCVEFCPKCSRSKFGSISNWRK